MNLRTDMEKDWLTNKRTDGEEALRTHWLIDGRVYRQNHCRIQGHCDLWTNQQTERRIDKLKNWRNDKRTSTDYLPYGLID